MFTTDLDPALTEKLALSTDWILTLNCFALIPVSNTKEVLCGLTLDFICPALRT